MISRNKSVLLALLLVLTIVTLHNKLVSTIIQPVVTTPVRNPAHPYINLLVDKQVINDLKENHVETGEIEAGPVIAEMAGSGAGSIADQVETDDNDVLKQTDEHFHRI